MVKPPARAERARGSIDDFRPAAEIVSSAARGMQPTLALMPRSVVPLVFSPSPMLLGELALCASLSTPPIVPSHGAADLGVV